MRWNTDVTAGTPTNEMMASPLRSQIRILPGKFRPRSFFNSPLIRAGTSNLNRKQFSITRRSRSNNSSQPAADNKTSSQPLNKSDDTLINTIFKSFTIGSAAGIMGSLAGMGGGFVMIPLMTTFLRLSQHQAHATSLAAVAATGCAGAVSFDSYVDYPAALAITSTAMVTAVLGARVTTILSEGALRKALGVLLLVMGPAVPAKSYFMKLKEEEETINVATNASSAHRESIPEIERLQAPALVGVFSGFLAGLFGVGGGAIVVPALTYSNSFANTQEHQYRQALATSLAAMTLPALAGTVTHARAGNLVYRVAPPLAIGALCGAYAGGKLAVHTDESTLQYGFSILLVALGIRTIRK